MAKKKAAKKVVKKAVKKTATKKAAKKAVKKAVKKKSGKRLAPASPSVASSTPAVSPTSSPSAASPFRPDSSQSPESILLPSTPHSSPILRDGGSTAAPEPDQPASPQPAEEPPERTWSTVPLTRKDHLADLPQGDSAETETPTPTPTPPNEHFVRCSDPNEGGYEYVKAVVVDTGVRMTYQVPGLVKEGSDFIDDAKARTWKDDDVREMVCLHLGLNEEDASKIQLTFEASSTEDPDDEDDDGDTAADDE